VFITERSIQTHALSKKKQKMKQTVFFFFSRLIHQANREPADHQRIPMTLTVNPSERLTSPLVKPFTIFILFAGALSLFFYT
jgi:hypothetical protein